MSGRICRETYANYGSYLRSRGYDKAICDLIDMIESGKIPVGPFIPVDKCNAILNGTLEIIECDGNIPGPQTGGVQSGMGQLWVQGGFNGPLGLARDLSIQAANGINSGGAIIQTGPSSFSVYVPNVGNISDHNYFESKTFLHGGLTMSDSINTSPSSVLTTITSIVKSDSSGLTVPWPNPATTTNDFPNDYTLATTKAIYDYVSSLADPKLKYIGNTGNETVDLAADTFNIVGTTGNIETTASSGSSSNNPSLKIDLVDILTALQAGTYGSQTVSGTTQTIKVPTITIDQKGRVTSASEPTNAIDVMSSFKVSDGTTTENVKNTGEIDFTVTNSNLTLNVSSGGVGNATVEHGLNSTLTGLDSVETDELIMPDAVSSSSNTNITSITNSITGTGTSNELATTNAIVSYVGAQTSGLMSSWSIGNGTTTTTVNNGDTVKIQGGNNINTSLSSTDITVNLEPTLTGLTSVTATTITDGTASMASGTISDGGGSSMIGGVVTANTISDGTASMINGVVTATTINSGTATMTGNIESTAGDICRAPAGALQISLLVHLVI